MRRNRKLFNLERKWIGKKVKYYTRDLPKKGSTEMPKQGPFFGIVEYLSNDQAEAEKRGDKNYGFTGWVAILDEGTIFEAFMDDCEIIS